jgi:SAM-dependent methyltransferase
MKRSKSSHDLEHYYKQRAKEYEDIYERPERQDDLQFLKTIISSTFQDRNVLEIACGTGYWTRYISECAESILATDINRDVLNLARSKSYHRCPVKFLKSNAYSLENVREKFTAGFCGFWWSHVPMSRRAEFLKVFHDRLDHDALVIMIDNNYVDNSNTPISRKDQEGNTYQIRKLKTDKEYEVLKNFPDENELGQYFARFADDIRITKMTYYWLLQYTLKRSG